MRKAITGICVVLLVAAFGSLTLAWSGKTAQVTGDTRDNPQLRFPVSGPGNSQKGGLPALADRVQKLEGQVSLLISQVGSLQQDVSALKSAVGALQTAVTSLQNAVSSLQDSAATIGQAVLKLQGQNNWAVVDSSANVVRHSGISNVTAAKMGTGTYEVTFANKDVTGCAYTATIGDVGSASAAPGFITVSGGVLKNLTDVQVQTFDKTGVAADSAFHLYVSCP